MNDFTWKDGDRTIRFGRGTADTALELLGTGFVLLRTARGSGVLPLVEEAAGEVLEGPAAVLQRLGELRPTTHTEARRL